jgi:CRISPR-associated endonuclease Csn1
MSIARGLVLGIDLGANSIGTALIDSSTQEVVFTGVRIFKAGVDKLDESKEASRAVERRTSRLMRRQTDRRRRRQAKIYGLLQRGGMLPPGDRGGAEFQALDRALTAKFGHADKMPYRLRALVLEAKLEPMEIGRALYHLAQRRGFQSNRKAGAKADEDRGKVKSGIGELEAKMTAAGASTVGQYFGLHVDPKEERIRSRYTHRSMFEKEFDAIWEAQRKHWPMLLGEPLRKDLRQAYFYQRPLRDQSDKVGCCDLEPGEKRAPMGLLEVQRFRFFSAANNLRLIDTNGNEFGLAGEQRGALLAMSLHGEKLKLSSIKKKLKLADGIAFTIERGGEENLPGNPTAVRMAKAMGREWEDRDLAAQAELVRVLLAQTGTDEEAEAELRAKFGLDEATAIAAAAVPLPEGYYSVSLAAIRKLMPRLEGGMTYAESRSQVYGAVRRTEPIPLLPGLDDERVKSAVGDIRNPIVLRALSEFRKTVNAIVRKYGRPDFIHIELARDIRKGVEERNRLSQKNRERENKRASAAAALEEHLGMPAGNISRRDIEKYLLWKECGCHCPYSGRAIALSALFGANAFFHIEHVVPFSVSLDDSFDNKTLCYHELNSVKRDRTPWEAFGAMADWEVMIGRVKGWNNPRKLRRFTMTEPEKAKLLEEFSTKQLNDTRYASRLAAQYAGLLYGGTVDADETKRVYTCSGLITAYLRNEWDLNRILNPNAPGKSRDDHRHHAVDAVAIAMCSQGTVQRLSEAASKAMAAGRRRFGVLEQPWVGFREQVAEKVLATVVSLKPEYKLQGAMHDQTLYGRPKKGGDGKSYVHVRKPVTGAKPEEIVDRRVRDAVIAKIAEVGSAKKLEGNWPVLMQKGGKAIPIRRVRVRMKAATTEVSHGAKKRWVLEKSIHHVEVVRNESGKRVKFDDHPVTTKDVLERKKDGKAIVRREFGERETFICTLRKGDVMEARKEGRPVQLWLVRNVDAAGQMEANLISDSRTKKEIIADKENGLWKPTVNAAFCNDARKVTVSHLGEILASHD